MLKVALTHDIDRVSKTYQYLTHTLRNLANLNLNVSLYHIKSLFIKDTYWNFDNIIKIENDFNIKSTFFFLNESIPFNLFDTANWKLSLGRYNISDKRITDIIKWLDLNGWEIGLHGSYNSFKNIELLEKEKNILENIVLHKIYGIRQHYLNLDDYTWSLQHKVGFVYDSSYGYSKDIGYKDNRYTFFKPMNNNFVVFPQVIMDTPFMSKQNKWEELERIIKISDRENTLLVINWHNDKFNNNEYPDFISAYIKIIEKCIENKAKFYKLFDYYNLINS